MIRLEKTNLRAFGAEYSIPMILVCPSCGERHIDSGSFKELAHHTHACQSCGSCWRPAKVNTHGVQFLPGYSNEDQPELPLAAFSDVNTNRANYGWGHCWKHGAYEGTHCQAPLCAQRGPTRAMLRPAELDPSDGA